MKSCIKILAGALIVVTLAFTGCQVETESLTQEQMVSKLDEKSKESIYEEILAGKNAEALLAKLSDTQKAALFDKMLTGDKKNAAFEEILAAKREDGKVVELLNDEEKAAVFDTLLAAKTSKDFIVGILTKEGNETLYNEIKEYFAGKFTKEELASLLAATDTTAPAAVENLTAASKDTGIELTWTDPSDADLWGFVIGYYEETSARALVLDSTKHEFVVGKSQNANKSNKAFVGNLTDKKSYIFYIKSIDENFNVSAAKESVSCTYNEKFVEVEVPVEVEKKLEAGTYTVYHFQQKTTGGKAVSDYELESTESNKSIAAESTIDDLKKTYEGFTEKTMSQNENAIYVFYDRNTITYTFQTGTEGKFEDGTTSKEVSGLYGAGYTKPTVPTSGDYNFVTWQDASETEAPSTFGAEDKTWTAVWRDKSEGGTPDYSTCVVGDFILKDGTVLSKDETPASGTVAAVIVRAATEDKPALGVGIVHMRGAWCIDRAAGFDRNITALYGDETSGYMDGSDGWEKLKAACYDAETHPEYYPAWNYSLTYAVTNGLTGALEEGWYLPTMAELYTIYQNKTVVDASLSKAGESQFGTGYYWSCCQYPFNIKCARVRGFNNGFNDYACKEYDYIYSFVVYVCSVRAFN